MTNQSKDILDNKYRIERAIRGGQGTVYVAVEIHGSSRKRVAIKRPINSDTEHVSAFRREIEVHKTLTFPGIPKIWDTFLDENELPHAVIEYIDGDDLAKCLDRQGGPFDIGTLRNWAGQLLDILVYMQDQKKPVIHADIKPSNIKIDEQGKLWLLDFGLSKSVGTVTLFENAGSRERTSAGYTAAYAAPEQLRNKKITIQSDLYSFGATLYKLATGEFPETATERLDRIEKGKPDPLPDVMKVNPLIPKDFSDAISACLRLDADERPANAKAARDLFLQRAKPRLETTVKDASATLVAPTQPDPVRVSAPAVVSAQPVFQPEKKKSLAFPVILGLVVVAGLGYWGLSLNDNKPEPKPPIQVDPLKDFVAKKLQMNFVKAFATPVPFQMGSTQADIARWKKIMGKYNLEPVMNDELPRHPVTIGKDFEIGQFEVTQAQWKQVAENLPKVSLDLKSKPSYFENCDDCPVESVSWNECKEFLARLNALNDGFTYRLPSEAEWEYACRGGRDGDYAGDELKKLAWFADNSGNDPMDSFKAWSESDTKWETYREKKLKPNNNRTHPFGQKDPNGFGLQDMHGNVWEWCEDVWHDTYQGAPSDGSAWTSGATSDRVVRGGSWLDEANFCRSAYRFHDAPDYADFGIGFRVVRVPRT